MQSPSQSLPPFAQCGIYIIFLYHLFILNLSPFLCVIKLSFFILFLCVHHLPLAPTYPYTFSPFHSVAEVAGWQVAMETVI